MWPKSLITTGIATGMAIALPLAMTVPVRAELTSGSVLNIASQGIGIVPNRKVTIELEESNRLVFRSGQAGRLLPTANQGSQLTLGLGGDRQINILPSSATFATAYADTSTIIQELPLNSVGVFQGEIPGFIQNIWLKTAAGAREAVNFTLFSVNYNAQTGQGEMTGAFIEADGTEHLANGSFRLDPNDGCTCNYAMQLEVQTIAAGSGIPGGAGPAGGGSSAGGAAPPAGITGGGGAFPLWALAALPFAFAFGGSSDNNASAPPNASPTPSPNGPSNGGNPNPPNNGGNPNPPDKSPTGDQKPTIPTPALLPGVIGMVWQSWRRQRSMAK
jgi:hypothetical protein